MTPRDHIKAPLAGLPQIRALLGEIDSALASGQHGAARQHISRIEGLANQLWFELLHREEQAG